jgi:mannose-6-phosphate isomerase-like protein (cupin superfamily)
MSGIFRYCSDDFLWDPQPEMGGLMNIRPWGNFTILEEQDTHKVKRIEVLPGKRLSYQRHEKRAEHWMVVRGQAVVTLEGREIPLPPGQSVDIPPKAAHRIFNPGKELLTFIEIQTGEYFGEDDITRLEDDFGRASER